MRKGKCLYMSLLVGLVEEVQLKIFNNLFVGMATKRVYFVLIDIENLGFIL